MKAALIFWGSIAALLIWHRARVPEAVDAQQVACAHFMDIDIPMRATTGPDHIRRSEQVYGGPNPCPR